MLHPRHRTPLLAVSIAVLCTDAVLAQSWRQQYPPLLPEVLDVDALSAVNVWVVGVDGTLRHTPDGGVTWSELAIGAATLSRVQFGSGGLGLAAGDGIWRTTDAGQNWERKSALAIRSIALASPQSAWALAEDGRVLRSTDGGSVWVDLGVPNGAVALRDLHFLASGAGWACGAGGELFSTVDGGTIWTARASGTTLDLTRVRFLDANAGWLCAGNSLLRTADGGASWLPATLPSGASAEDVHFLTAQRGWACGPGGAVLSTVNGGATWTAGSGAGTTNLHALDCTDFFNGWTVGTDGRVLATSNGGASWTQVAGGAAAPTPAVFAVEALDGQQAWAATYSGYILRTTDGGANWSPVPSGVNYQWRDVSFFDALHGYACGKKQAYFPAFARTNDGGLSWIPVDYGGLFDLNDVEALGPDTAVVAGETFVFRTTNGGLNWTSITPLPYSTFHGMDFVGGQTGWIAGHEIFRTDDGGLSWTLQTTPPITMFDVDFVDASTGWCVGNGGTIMKSTDGGATWTTSTIPGFTFGLQAVTAVDPTHLWVVGDGGFVARSSDGGQNWAVESPGLHPNAQPICAKFVTADDGWIGGNFEVGVWSRTASGTSCPAPQPYCTAKPNSSGTLCQLYGIGTPSLSGPGFGIAFQGGLPGNLAFFAWTSAGADNVPFHGGTLCIAQPFVRMLRFNMDLLGGGMQPIPITPDMVNTTRWYQLYYRDAANPDGTGWGISNGIAVGFCD